MTTACQYLGQLSRTFAFSAIVRSTFCLLAWPLWQKNAVDGSSLVAPLSRFVVIFQNQKKNVLFIKLFIVNGVCCNWSSFPSRVFFSCNFESDSIDPNFKSSLLSLLTSFGSLSATESFDVLAVPAERVLFTSAQFLLFRVSLVITCSAGVISGIFQVRLFLRCGFHLGCL